MFFVSSANPFAYIALVLFVPYGLILFHFLSPVRAALVVALTGPMFLPEMVNLDLPGLPRLGKDAIMVTTLTLGMLVNQWPRLAKSRPGSGIEILIPVMLVGGWLTTLTNGDSLQYGPRFIEGIEPYELITATMLDLLRFGLPFYLGRVLFRSERDLRDLMTAMIIAGVVYSLLALVEMRLSPQLHRWTYGFHQNSFGSLKRWGGYRPMIFMDSGIAAAVFMLTTTMAAATAARARIAIFGRISARLIAPYLLVVLLLCKSVAAMVWGALLTPVLLFLSPRMVARGAMLAAALVFFYPTIRIVQLFPWQGIVAFAESIDPARARSLNYRFENEERMLAKARQRFAFGWGGYSRNWEYNATTGIAPSVPDGFWIIRLSSAGLVGFYTYFGLYVLPVLLAWRQLGRIPGRENQAMIAGLMLMVIIRAVDQLPNGMYSTFPLFLAGALHNLRKALPREHARRKRDAPKTAVAADEVEVQATGTFSGLVGPSGPGYSAR